MGSIPDARARCSRTWSGGWRGPAARFAAAPAPSLTVARAPPTSFLLAGLGLGHGRLDPGGAERDPGAVVHGPGLGDQPDTLTGWPWRIPEGWPGTLTARISAAPSARAISCTTSSGSPFSSALGRRVSKSRTGCGSRAHRNAIAEASTGSFMLTLLLRMIRTIEQWVDLYQHLA